MRVALDAMGGDAAPDINIDGALAAIAANPALRISLVGDEVRLRAALASRQYSGSEITVVPADGFVDMDEKPIEALLKKPKCSIAVCWKLMAAREVEAVVSAGHTGAVVAAGLRTKLFLRGIKRPGIAVCLPTPRGGTVLMDVGANPEARAEHLAQYAIMGCRYAQAMLRVEQPRLGVLNIGSENGKGTELVREAAQLIADGPVKSMFIGNVEGRELFNGQADVVVCDGFVGNVVLKASEGLADMILHTLAHGVVAELQHEKERAVGAFHKMGERFRYSETGGAPLLGIDGLCLICHGSSDATTIRNALRTVGRLNDSQLNDRIVETINGHC